MSQIVYILLNQNGFSLKVLKLFQNVNVFTSWIDQMFLLLYLDQNRVFFFWGMKMHLSASVNAYIQG